MLFAPLALSLSFAFAAAAPPVILQAQRPVTQAAHAFPRISAPATPATSRINAALGRGDARLRVAVRDCTGPGGKGRGDWSRTVTTPFTGPDFLSVVAADDYYCGGPYPDTATLPLTYDLATGAPVNWAKLFPPSVTGTATTDSVSDGTTVGTLTSARLSALYRRKATAGQDKELRKDCDGAYEQPLALMLWLDAKTPGVSIETNAFPHAMKACAETVTLTLTDLKALGADARLIRALQAGHAAHGWTDARKRR